MSTRIHPKMSTKIQKEDFSWTKVSMRIHQKCPRKFTLWSKIRLLCPREVCHPKLCEKVDFETIFTIVWFSRGAKFVLSGDPLYLSFSNPIINNLPNVQCAMQCAVMNEINAVWSVTAERNFNLSLLTPSVPPHIKLKVWKSFKNWFPLKLWSFLHFKRRRA